MYRVFSFSNKNSLCHEIWRKEWLLLLRYTWAHDILAYWLSLIIGFDSSPWQTAIARAVLNRTVELQQFDFMYLAIKLFLFNFQNVFSHFSFNFCFKRRLERRYLMQFCRSSVALEVAMNWSQVKTCGDFTEFGSDICCGVAAISSKSPP